MRTSGSAAPGFRRASAGSFHRSISPEKIRATDAASSRNSSTPSMLKASTIGER
jgi:hypothetical protein